MGVFAYYDTETDGTIYHVIPSPQSENTPSSFHSESDSTSSGLTIVSDDLPGYFVLHRGRKQAASDNVAKWFPSDDIRRYIVRYLVARSVIGGHYRGPVKEILAPIEERQLQVLELGTRTGTWIQAMATEFPHVQFRTLDVVPMIPHVPRHNVIFEVYDFTEGLLLEDESQDAVFLNIILEVVKDYKSLLREVYRVLRPGGLIHIHDYNPYTWDPEDITKSAQHKSPRLCRFNEVVRQQITTLGIDPDMCDKLPRWLAPSSDLWGPGQSGFTAIQSDLCAYPFFPHDGYSCMNWIDASISPYIRYLMATSMRDMIGLLMDFGLTDEEAKKLIDDGLDEAKNHDNCSVFKTYCVYAIKA